MPDDAQQPVAVLAAGELRALVEQAVAHALRVQDREVMTRDEAAEFLRVSPRTLDRWEGKGLLRSVKLPPPNGTSKPVRRFRRADLRKFVDSHARK
ncbi:helix-turn-helix domain-containing protein [Planctomycetota bacterium]